LSARGTEVWRSLDKFKVKADYTGRSDINRSNEANFHSPNSPLSLVGIQACVAFAEIAEGYISTPTAND
jgi:hypothetical protein